MLSASQHIRSDGVQLPSILLSDIVDSDELPSFGEPTLKPFGTRYSHIEGGSGRMTVIVDITGVHELPIKFCKCINAPPDDQQLLMAGLYPATSALPRTAFTFSVLDDFLASNRTCKTAGRIYFAKLKHITNNAFPHMVPVSC